MGYFWSTCHYANEYPNQTVVVFWLFWTLDLIEVLISTKFKSIVVNIYSLDLLWINCYNLKLYVSSWLVFISIAHRFSFYQKWEYPTQCVCYKSQTKTHSQLILIGNIDTSYINENIFVPFKKIFIQTFHRSRLYRKNINSWKPL